MKKKIYEILMKMVAVASAAAICVGGMPAGYVFAEDVSVTDSVTNRTVTGRFTVSESDLADMGYGPTASVPLNIGLSYESASSRYSGSGEVYAYGVINSGKQISVSIDTSDERLGDVYDSNNVDCTTETGSGYDCSLSKVDWSRTECYKNYTDISDGKSVTHMSVLSVTVPKACFIPTGTGDYKAYVPLKIQLTEE